VAACFKINLIAAAYGNVIFLLLSGIYEFNSLIGFPVNKPER